MNIKMLYASGIAAIILAVGMFTACATEQEIQIDN